MSNVVVLGSGIIGLCVALELVDKGYKPTIVARDLPQDTDSPGFASPWAGCNWHPFDNHDGTTVGSQCDAATFKRLGKYAEVHPDLVERIPFIDLFSVKESCDAHWYKDLVGDMRAVQGTSSKPLPGGLPYGIEWSSYIINAPNFMKHLTERLQAHNVKLMRKRISSLDEAYDIPEIEGDVDLVVNATGLGSKTLLGVEDKGMLPAKGQTVLVKAPGIKNCYMHTEGFVEASVEAPKPVYIIPRPGPDGQIVLGGTYLEENYTTDADPKEAERILKSCYALEPRLARNGSSWKDIEVISHNVGLRPVRRGGPRIELEERTLGVTGGGKRIRDDLKGKKVGVVHAYGFGPAGYQQSFGAAEKVAALVDSWAKK